MGNLTSQNESKTVKRIKLWSTYFDTCMKESSSTLTHAMQLSAAYPQIGERWGSIYSQSPFFKKSREHQNEELQQLFTAHLDAKGKVDVENMSDFILYFAIVVRSYTTQNISKFTDQMIVTASTQYMKMAEASVVNKTKVDALRSQNAQNTKKKGSASTTYRATQKRGPSNSNASIHPQSAGYASNYGAYRSQHTRSASIHAQADDKLDRTNRPTVKVDKLEGDTSFLYRNSITENDRRSLNRGKNQDYFPENQYNAIHTILDPTTVLEAPPQFTNLENQQLRPQVEKNIETMCRVQMQASSNGNNNSSNNNNNNNANSDTTSFFGINVSLSNSSNANTNTGTSTNSINTNSNSTTVSSSSLVNNQGNLNNLNTHTYNSQSYNNQYYNNHFSSHDEVVNSNINNSSAVIPIELYEKNAAREVLRTTQILMEKMFLLEHIACSNIQFECDLLIEYRHELAIHFLILISEFTTHEDYRHEMMSQYTPLHPLHNINCMMINSDRMNDDNDVNIHSNSITDDNYYNHIHSFFYSKYLADPKSFNCNTRDVKIILPILLRVLLEPLNSAMGICDVPLRVLKHNMNICSKMSKKV